MSPPFPRPHLVPSDRTLGGGHCRFVAAALPCRAACKGGRACGRSRAGVDSAAMTIEIGLLGHFSVRRDGVEVPPAAFRGRLVRTLVRVLVTRRGSFVSRDVLTEALWPDGPPADPDLNLNVLVTRARRALGDPSLIHTAPGGYSFVGGAACSVDAEVFLEQVRTGRSLLGA